jgi:hypothetical protein
MASPGIGEQHFAKRTSRSPTPLTLTPVVDGAAGGASSGSMIAASSWISSLLTTDAELTAP